jgi:hypothetical protein
LPIAALLFATGAEFTDATGCRLFAGAGAALVAEDSAAGLHADKASAAIITIVTSHNFDFMLFPPVSNDDSTSSHVEWYCLDLNEGC